MKLPAALLALCALACATNLSADTPTPAPDPAARLAQLRVFADSLKPQAGEITLQGGVAKISLTGSYRYLGPDDAQTVLCNIWGNPMGPKSLGMIVPTGFNPLRAYSWVIVLTYSEDGFIKDDDAAKLDYNKLLEQMKDGTKQVSDQRMKHGFSSVELVGWAALPKYDAVNHKMYWAKELRFGPRGDETLNYNIRILGRRGVLVLNAVAEMQHLAQVEKATPDILKMVNFQDGSRYSDFNPSTDKVATYGLAALVLGGIAAKAGFLKILLVGLLAVKKFIIVAALAVAGYFKKIMAKFKKKPGNDGGSGGGGALPGT